jgi:hypothetical protein
MPEFDCLSRNIGWIDLERVEQQRHPEVAIQVGIQLRFAGLSLSIANPTRNSGSQM